MLTSGVPRYSVLGDGSVFMPAQEFSQENNTGIYREINTSTTGATSSAWAVSKSGTKRMRITDTGGDLYGIWNTGTLNPGTVQLADGSATAPSLTFVSDTKTGLYRPGANRLGISIAGTETVDFGVSQTDFKSGSLTGITSTYVADGKVTAPSYSFTSEPSLGFYKPSIGSIEFASGNLNIFGADSTRFVTSVPLAIPDGSATAPAYSFTSESSLGLYRPGPGKLAQASGNTTIWSADTGGFSTLVPFAVPNGTAAVPGLQFSGAGPPGLYYDNVNTIKIEVAPSAPVLNISTKGPIVTSRTGTWLVPTVPLTKTALTWASPATTPASLSPVLTYAVDVTNGDTWTVGQTGIYSLTIYGIVTGTGAAPVYYITKNGTSTTLFAGVTSTNSVFPPLFSANASACGGSVTALLTAGDVLRTHASSNINTPPTTFTNAYFTINFLTATATSL